MRSQRLEFCHDGIAQRWLVVFSQAAALRAEATGSTGQPREEEASQKQLFHWQAQRFASESFAQEALSRLGKEWRYHQRDSSELTAHKHDGKKGRPSADTPLKATAWQMQAHVKPDAERIKHAKQLASCFVLGSTIPTEQRSDVEVMADYKGQAQAEGGCRFLKDPLFFVSSLFVKKPSRMQGLLMVMTLSLLVYAVAQRRLRQELARQNGTLPNQINQPTSRPTLRWVFQLLEGIHRVQVTVQDQVHTLIEGLNEGRIKILRLFGERVCQVYQISSG